MEWTWKTPAYRLQVEDTTAANTSNYISVVSGNAGNAGIAFGDSDADLVGGILYNNSDNALRFFRSGFTEAMRINSGSELQIGGTTNAGFIDFDSTKLQLNTQRNPNTGAFVNTSKSHASIELDGSNGGSAINFRTAAANNTVGSIRMKIHSDGEVTMPLQPAFRVDQTGQSGRSTGYYTVVFSGSQTNCFDIGNNFNNNIFTAPVDGVYFFSCSIRVDSVSGYFRIYISKNSSTDTNINLHAIVGNGISTNYENLQVSGTLYLSETDTARVIVYSDSDSNWTSQGEGHFSGFLVG